MCPRCSGKMIPTWEEPTCINCGYVQFDILTLAASYAEAATMRPKREGDGRKGRRTEPFHRFKAA